MKRPRKTGARLFCLINLLTLAVMLGACASPAAVATNAKTAATATANIASASAAALDNATPPEEIAPTAVLTPPPLPPIFQTPYLNPLDTPRAYIHDTCKYLRTRWNPSYAEPGTVVMIVMFNGVYNGTVDSFDGVEANELRRIMTQLKEQGFMAINTEEFLAFMERNVKIPARSVLFVRDGNYGQENYYEHFGRYWKEWDWHIVNGWVSWEDTPESLWEENVLLEYEGFVDHQARGVQPNAYLTNDSSKVVIARELQGPLEAFADHFGKNPLAVVWPNGGFGQRPVMIARELNYQLGFTLNSRGPVMYNWVPQADKFDKERPSYIPEGAIGDPLMTLPRFWPYQVLSSLDTVRVISKEAKAYADANKEAEFAYYKVVCEAEYGPIPLTPK